MKFLHVSLAVLIAFAGLYLYFFPNNFDTTSHYGTVVLTHRDGFSRYTTQWYAGSPMLVVYQLGFWLAHALAQLVGPTLAYLLVEFAAVAGIALGAWRVGQAMGLERERRALLLLLFVASPMFFYSWLRVDRFPTLVGAAIALFALEQALAAKEGLSDWKRLLKNAVLLGLAALASVHAALIAGAASAYLLVTRTRKIGLKEMIFATASSIAFALVALPLARSLLEFLPYANPLIQFGPHNPLVLLSWLGPLATAVFAWVAAGGVAERMKIRRRTVVVAFAVLAAGLFFGLGWGTSVQQTLLLLEFVGFLLAGELLNAFSEVNAKPKIDFELSFAALLVAAGLTNSFFVQTQLNPVVYVFFAAFFLSAWLARNWLPQKTNAAYATAMILLSIPLATVMTPDYLNGGYGVAPVRDYLAAQQGFGRVVFVDCPPSFYYASLDSRKPTVGGTAIYSNLDPLLRQLEFSKDGATLRRVIADESYKVKWIVSCDLADYSVHGFRNALTGAVADVWEKTAAYELVDGAEYEWTGGNEIVLRGSEGAVAAVSLAYYPALECEGCEFVERGTHEVKVRMTAPRARLYVRDDSFERIGASVLVTIAALLIAAVF